MDFLEKNSKIQPLPGHIAGIRKIIENISALGFDSIPKKMFDCWKEEYRIKRKNMFVTKKCQFCELKKDRYRISAFRCEDDRKLLLATCFIKTKMKQVEEYSRALDQYSRFLQNPVWED